MLARLADLRHFIAMGSRKTHRTRAPSQDRAHRAEIVDRLYEVALDPIRLEQLLDDWENRQSPEAGAGAIFDDQEFDAHLRRASVFLDRFEVTREDGGYRSILEDLPRTAAFVSDGGPTIIGFNQPAAQVFGLSNGAKLNDLPFEPDDIGILRESIARVASGREEKVITLRIGVLGRDTPVMVRVGPVAGGEAEPLALVVSTELVWPEEFAATLQDAFGLTLAEVEIVRGISLGQPVKEIAEQRGRSAETVRTQLRSILSKTETHSQSELVRVVLGLMDVMSLPNDAVTSLPPRPGALEPVAFHSLHDPAGRRLTWIEFGSPFGAPCVVCHTDYGLIRWPAAAEQMAQRMGIRVIVPVRAGYGRSAALPADADELEGVTQDYLTVVDHLGLTRFAVLAMGSALRHALCLSLARPDMVSGILGCACQLPLQHTGQYERMDKWQRFTVDNARNAPKILPFVVKAAFSMALRAGKETFFAQTNGGSPADMAAFARPEVREAVLAGSEVLLSQTVRAHAAFTREAIGSAQDWSQLVRKAQVPVRLLQGDQDPMTPMQTVREVMQSFGNLDVQFLPNTGQLLFFTEWHVVLQELQRFLQRR